MQAVTGQSEEKYSSNSYFTMNLGAQCKINNNAKVFAQLNNITNASYEEYGDWLLDPNDYSNTGIARYPMASRNFVVGMEYSF